MSSLWLLRCLYDVIEDSSSTTICIWCFHVTFVIQLVINSGWNSLSEPILYFYIFDVHCACIQVADELVAEFADPSNGASTPDQVFSFV